MVACKDIYSKNTEKHRNSLFTDAPLYDPTSPFGSGPYNASVAMYNPDVSVVGFDVYRPVSREQKVGERVFTLIWEINFFHRALPIASLHFCKESKEYAVFATAMLTA